MLKSQLLSARTERRFDKIFNIKNGRKCIAPPIVHSILHIGPSRLNSIGFRDIWKIVSSI